MACTMETETPLPRLRLAIFRDRQRPSGPHERHRYALRSSLLSFRGSSWISESQASNGARARKKIGFSRTGAGSSHPQIVDDLPRDGSPKTSMVSSNYSHGWVMRALISSTNALEDAVDCIAAFRCEHQTSRAIGPVFRKRSHDSLRSSVLLIHSPSFP